MPWTNVLWCQCPSGHGRPLTSLAGYGHRPGAPGCVNEERGLWNETIHEAGGVLHATRYVRPYPNAEGRSESVCGLTSLGQQVWSEPNCPECIAELRRRASRPWCLAANGLWHVLQPRHYVPLEGTRDAPAPVLCGVEGAGMYPAQRTPTCNACNRAVERENLAQRIFGRMETMGTRVDLPHVRDLAAQAEPTVQVYVAQNENGPYRSLVEALSPTLTEGDPVQIQSAPAVPIGVALPDAQNRASIANAMGLDELVEERREQSFQAAIETIRSWGHTLTSEEVERIWRSPSLRETIIRLASNGAPGVPQIPQEVYDELARLRAVNTPPPFNEAAYDLMLIAEGDYLRVNGWVENGVEDWSHPTLWGGRQNFNQGRAVNSQKQADRQHAGRRPRRTDADRRSTQVAAEGQGQGAGGTRRRAPAGATARGRHPDDAHLARFLDGKDTARGYPGGEPAVEERVPTRFALLDREEEVSDQEAYEQFLKDLDEEA